MIPKPWYCWIAKDAKEVHTNHNDKNLPLFSSRNWEPDFKKAAKVIIEMQKMHCIDKQFALTNSPVQSDQKVAKKIVN